MFALYCHVRYGTEVANQKDAAVQGQRPEWLSASAKPQCGRGHTAAFRKIRHNTVCNTGRSASSLSSRLSDCSYYD